MVAKPHLLQILTAAIVLRLLVFHSGNPCEVCVYFVEWARRSYFPRLNLLPIFTIYPVVISLIEGRRTEWSGQGGALLAHERKTILVRQVRREK